jgi:hypothetical protein
MTVHDTPNSSNIARIKYDAEAGQLHVEFRTRKTYVYEDVPPEIWNQFVSSESAGKFFASNIKGKYAYL